MSDLKSESEKKPDLQPGAREPFRLIIPKNIYFCFSLTFIPFRKKVNFSLLGKKIDSPCFLS